MSSHRECSHHCFYNGVGGLNQAVVPIGVQRLGQLAALHAVLFGARTRTSLYWGRHCLNPLDERAVGLEDLDDHYHGDADHGGQGQRPAQADGPVWVLIHLVIGQWLVLHQ